MSESGGTLEWGEAVGGWRLSVSLDGARFPVDGPVLATIILQNVSPQVQGFGGYGRDFDHDFDCRSGESERVPLTRFGQAMVANRGLGKSVGGHLQSAESAVVEVSLSRHLDLSLPGMYSLVVSRQVHGSDDVVSTVRSNRLELEIVE